LATYPGFATLLGGIARASVDALKRDMVFVAINGKQ